MFNISGVVGDRSELCFEVEQFRPQITKYNWDVRVLRYKGGSPSLAKIVGTWAEQHALILIQGRDRHNIGFQTIIDLVTNQEGVEFKLPYTESYNCINCIVPTIIMNRLGQRAVNYYEASVPFSVPSYKIVNLFSNSVYEISPGQKSKVRLENCVAIPEGMKYNLFGQTSLGNYIYTYLSSTEVHNCLTLASRLLHALDIPANPDDNLLTTSSVINNLNQQAGNRAASGAPSLITIYQSIRDNNMPHLKSHIDFIKYHVNKLHTNIVISPAAAYLGYYTFLSMAVLRGNLEAVIFLVNECDANIEQQFGIGGYWTALDCVYRNDSIIKLTGAALLLPKMTEKLRQDERRRSIESLLIRGQGVTAKVAYNNWQVSLNAPRQPILSAIYQAIKDNDIATLRSHIEFIKAHVNGLHRHVVEGPAAAYLDYHTFLCMAVIAGHPEVVQFLVRECDADIKQRVGVGGMHKVLDLVYCDNAYSTFISIKKNELILDDRRTRIGIFLRNYWAHGKGMLAVRQNNLKLLSSIGI